MDFFTLQFWNDTIVEAFDELTKYLSSNATQFFKAILILILGISVAYFLKFIAAKAILNLDIFFKKSLENDRIHQRNLKQSYALIVSQALFWMALFMTVTASADTIGWQWFAKWANAIVNYIPNLLTSLFILLVGYLLGNGIKAKIITILRPFQGEYSTFFGQIMKSLVLLSTLVISIEQLGFDLKFITTFITVIIAVALAGIALAFAFGAKDVVANIVATSYIKTTIKLNDHVRINGVEGNVINFSKTGVILQTETCQIMIPSRIAMETSVILSHSKERVYDTP